MPKKTIEIEADSLEEARQQIKSRAGEGLTPLSETIVSDGKPRTVTSVAGTEEAARQKAQSQIPGSAGATESRVLATPEQQVIVVEAEDEANARLSASRQAQSQYGKTAEVQSVRLLSAGRKGLLGLGKTPGRYEATISRPAVVEVTYKPKARISVEMALSYTKGLRPLGNKKRLTQTTEEVSFGYDVRLLLFRDRGSAETYYDLFVAHASNRPPPYLIEIMVAFLPRSIFAEKYAVVIPNEGTDTRPGYEQWAREAIWTCNDTLRIHNSTDHKYAELHRYVDMVYKWDILIPAGFSATSSEAQELLRDGPDEGYPALKALGQEGVALPPEKPQPLGPWVGVLFEIAQFDEASYGDAATRLLFEIAGKQQLGGCVIHGGDIPPECRYWCSAVHTSSVEQAQRLEQAVLAASDPHLAPAEARVLRSPQVPVHILVYQGFVSEDGVYVGV